jgi:hypothetical protein
MNHEPLLLRAHRRHDRSRGASPQARSSNGS